MLYFLQIGTRDIAAQGGGPHFFLSLTLLSFAAVYALMGGRLEALRMTAVTAEGCLLVGGYLISSTRSG